MSTLPFLLPQSQHRALMDFYAAIGCPTTLCTRFAVNAPCPQSDSVWLGCGPTSANVVRLMFNDRQLTGTIPTTMAALSLLTSLRLANNSLTGPLPSTIGLLTRLEILDLAHNAIDGRVPSQLANLSALTFLTLNHNQLTGTPRLSSMFNVCVLQTPLANETNCLTCPTDLPTLCQCRAGTLRCAMAVTGRPPVNSIVNIPTGIATSTATTTTTAAATTTTFSSLFTLSTSTSTSFPPTTSALPTTSSPTTMSIAIASAPSSLNWGLWGGVIGGAAAFLILLAIAIAVFVRSRRASTTPATSKPHTADYASPPQQVLYADGNLTAPL